MIKDAFLITYQMKKIKLLEEALVSVILLFV